MNNVFGEAQAVIEAAELAPAHPESRYDLLAAMQGLKRLPLCSCGQGMLRRGLTALLDHRSPASSIAIAFDNGVWLRGAAKLVRAYRRAGLEDPFAPGSTERSLERENLARELVDRLDDAGLVASAVRGATDLRDWSRGVQVCQNYAAMWPELFYEAGDWATQACGRFRLYGEVEAENRELGRTIAILQLVAGAWASRINHPEIPFPKIPLPCVCGGQRVK